MSADALLSTAKQLGVKIVVAESLTGGLLAAEFVKVAGASESFVGGVVAYDSRLKSELLGVSAEVLQRVGAVDADVALQMALGAIQHVARAGVADQRSILAISTTGVAGPDSQDGAPVGTVFIGMAFSDFENVLQFAFSGDRQSIREQTVNAAIEAGFEALR